MSDGLKDDYTHTHTETHISFSKSYQTKDTVDVGVERYSACFRAPNIHALCFSYSCPVYLHTNSQMCVHMLSIESAAPFE